MPCRLELLKLQDQTLEAKLAQKHEEEQEDASWSAQPDYAHTVDRSMPWTVPSQLLTAEEEVSTVLLGHLTLLEPQSCCAVKRSMGTAGDWPLAPGCLLDLGPCLCSCWWLTRRSQECLENASANG